MSNDLMTIVTVSVLYAAVVVSPGPNFALICRLAISGATNTARGATLGLAVAATFYAIMSMTGLTLVLSRVGWLAGLVQMAGGVFLIYLGFLSWLRPRPEAGSQVRMPTHDAFSRGFRIGLLVNLSNPKAIAFFVSLYAVAIPAVTALGAKSIILLAGFALEILWYGFVILILSRGPAQDIYHRLGGWIERGLGTLLILFGIRLMTDRPS